jgi:TetR/AcrR family transcriptional repressor of lmrAB and yxaGH operons
LEAAPNTAVGLVRFLEIAGQPDGDDPCPGCPIAPTALESPLISTRLRDAAARSFEHWQELIAQSLRNDGWPQDTLTPTASSLLALIEGALLLAKVSGDVGHLTHAERAIASLLGSRQ